MTKPAIGDELFSFGQWTWNITNALTNVEEAMKADPDDAYLQQAPVAKLASMLPFMLLDEEHAMTADLSKPLLAAPVPDEGALMVIDGWHRILRAHREGVEQLPLITLTEEESTAVRTAYRPG